MKKYKHILNEEEKKVIENHFVLNGNNSKQDYKKFCEDTVAHYTGKPFSLSFKEQVKAKDYEHSIDLIWDEHTNTTAIMHCFSHPKFLLSNTKLKHFKTFNGNFNAINSDGQTALMMLAKGTNHDYMFASLIDSSDIFNLYIRDKEDKTFHIYFFSHYDENTFALNKNKNEKNRYRDAMLPLLGKMDYFKKVLEDWINSDIPKSSEQTLFVGEKALIVSKGIENLTNSKEAEDYNKHMLMEDARSIGKIGQALQLNATMTVNKQIKNNTKI